jgi:hypothetical protein
MYNGYRFIDSDAHILEPPDLWERYLAIFAQRPEGVYSTLEPEEG